jgi:fatty-acyl-CoA synthase
LPAARTVIDAWFTNGCTAAFHVDNGDGQPLSSLSGEGLRRKAVAAAGVLKGLGVGPGDRVAMVLPTCEALVVAILATWLRRAAFVLLPCGTAEGRAHLAPDRLGAMMSSVRPKLVLARSDELDRIGHAAPGHLAAVEDLLTPGAVDESDALMPREEDVAFLQFTSGSTALPKAVVNTHGAVLLNTRAAGVRAGADATSCSVSWLPLHHDFGLLSSVVSPLCFGYRSVLIPTGHFLRRPWVWLQHVSAFGGTHSATPPSALDMLARIAGSPRLAGIDLSFWRYIFVAALWRRNRCRRTRSSRSPRRSHLTGCRRMPCSRPTVLRKRSWASASERLENPTLFSRTARIAPRPPRSWWGAGAHWPGCG